MILQIGSREDMQLRTLVNIFNQIFGQKFFQKLRTEKKLGYIVQLQRMFEGLAMSISMYVQSDHTNPIILDRMIDEFLETAVEEVANMPDTEFQKYKDTRSKLCLDKPVNLDSEFVDYSDIICAKVYDFGYRLKLFDLNERVTKGDLITFIRTHIIPSAPKRRKLSTHVWPLGKSPSYSDVEKAKIVDDAEAFKERQDYFVHMDQHSGSNIPTSTSSSSSMTTSTFHNTQ